MVPDDNDIIYQTRGLDIVGIVERVTAFFRGDTLSSAGGFSSFLTFLGHFWQVYSIIAIALALLFFAGFIYAKIRYGQLGEILDAQIEEGEKRWDELHGGGSKTGTNVRWQEVMTHVASQNPNDWRLAIIEADILLEDTLEGAGFPGATIGEKLKSANPTSFTTLQDAWDAHKIRNQIAHSGSDFVLTQRIAQEAIIKYERVFKEFGIL
ncbi:hypothetical protein GW943_00945 [Candidatus Parcubacteria bacterium]|uniref:Uncharacterized protein n=1 Tax=Candidatus Kaiserbacteria bacterium CG10_big_fil_rev_8_21_14_0_10_47_16 TaxID=1974608 RepID=A0A2H0UDB2_9BACT|nr:hypothetical protein [Candidatus Parcubacteria bacterium]PIR84399.1 MAG: hypothetical protein COU16_02325 [Candidatus Kaiserbacteria bacterium CG10_big_fil_rev_8_21_14_0_10_47_16]